MPAAEEQPTAVRAVASTRESRLTHRPIRVCRYDAYWPDGRVDFDVDLAKAMYRGQPADFHPIQIAVHVECPEFGAGPWIDQRGQIIDGPDPEEPDWLKPGTGRPAPYHPPHQTPSNLHRTATYAWRIGPGAAALAIGLLLLIRSPGASAVGLLGVICVVIGLSSIYSLLASMRRRRR